MKKFFKVFFIVFTILIVGIITTAICLWHNEGRTVFSINMKLGGNEENNSGPVYEMNVKGSYYIDDFIKQGGVSSDQELIDFIVKKITKGLIPIKIKAPTIGCASFTGVTEEGERLFARSYDFSKTTSMIVRTNPKRGYRSISSVDLQFLGIKDGSSVNDLMEKIICLAAPYVPLDGINEKGLACGIYMTYQGQGGVVATNQNTDKPDVTSTTLLRLMLDKCATVEEAVELAKSYDLHDSANTSFHYMVADATGKSAILEWVGFGSDSDGAARILNVIYNDSDSTIGLNEGIDDFQYVTNFICTAGYYSSDEQKYGFDRYNAIREAINPDGSNIKGVISKEKALDVLKLVGRRSWDKNNGATDSNAITVWSALYDLTNKTVTWVSNEEFNNEKAIFKISV